MDTKEKQRLEGMGYRFRATKKIVGCDTFTYILVKKGRTVLGRPLQLVPERAWRRAIHIAHKHALKRPGV